MSPGVFRLASVIMFTEYSFYMHLAYSLSIALILLFSIDVGLFHYVFHNIFTLFHTIFTIPCESVAIVTRLNCCVILAGFAATIFMRLPSNTLVDFYVVFSLIFFDSFSEIKCVQSRTRRTFTLSRKYAVLLRSYQPSSFVGGKKFILPSPSLSLI